jgi:ribonuclease HI
VEHELRWSLSTKRVKELLCGLTPQIGHKMCSYKLVFDCTNNMAEYEALVLGLKALKEMGARRIVFHGDSELIINQVKGIYQENHPILREYRNSA